MQPQSTTLPAFDSTCEHMRQPVPTGACWICRPEMFRFSPAEVEAMNRVLIAYQHGATVDGPPECAVEGCSEPVRSKGFCKSHYAQVRYVPSSTRPQPRAESEEVQLLRMLRGFTCYLHGVLKNRREQS